MSLLTYDDAPLRAVKKKASGGQVHPWYINRNVGLSEFRDSPSLSEAEIAVKKSYPNPDENFVLVVFTDFPFLGSLQSDSNNQLVQSIGNGGV